MPSVVVPMGEKSALIDDSALYTLGAGTSLHLQYIFPDLPMLYLDGNLGYGYQPTQAQLLNMVTTGIGTGGNIRAGDRTSFTAGTEFGWYLAMYPDAPTASNPWVGVRVTGSMDFTPSFTLTVGGGYRLMIGYDTESSSFTELFQGLNFSIGTTIPLAGGENRNKVKTENIDFSPIFPVFYGYYDTHPVGNVTIKNGENGTITDLQVSFFVNQYMEQPKVSEPISQLKRGETTTVNLNALFTNSVMQLTESTRVSAEILTEYTYLGKSFQTKTPYTLRIYDRNSMTWDDDRKAASFITPKDPTVLLFSKNTAGIIREEGNNPINLNFRIALGIFETLRLYGINYVIDPQSSYVEAIRNEQFIDYLQFPSQTLTFRAGDCDDLSILYSALLESVGIETAFITIPGHIFMAFALDMDVEAVKRTFTNFDDFIFRNDKVWVPVEVTLIPDGFMKAWRIGAKQWREYSINDKAAFYEIHNAWNKYEPIALPGTALSLVFPSKQNIVNEYKGRLNEFIQREIEPRVGEFNERIQRYGETASLRNSFGVLFARYGRFDPAVEQFKRAVAMNPNYVPSLINLGNIHFLNEEMETALAWYSKAEALRPENPKVLAVVARTQYELEKYEAVRERYAKLKIHAPDLALEYAYLGNETSSIGRAAAAKSKGITLWDEE